VVALPDERTVKHALTFAVVVHASIAAAQPAPKTEPAKPIDAAKPQVTSEEDAPPKLSLPTEADREAWTRPGFRLELGLTYGQFHGLRGAPSGRLLGPKLRAGLRLDRDWSLMTSFEYTSAKRSGGLAGLRFAGTLDPTWHATRAFAVAVGFGFAGIVEGGTSRMDASPLPDEITSSYTFPDASHPIASCSGVGAAGLVRGEYSYVLGPRASLRIDAEAIGQWTGCVDDTGNFDPDTGQAIVRRQWWPHVGGTLTLGVMWR
jgi:hypothetical protein